MVRHLFFAVSGQTSQARLQMFTSEPMPTILLQQPQQLSLTKHSAKAVELIILWRIERMSRLFPAALRHEKEKRHRNAALKIISHAPTLVINRPGIFLRTMFPKYGKGRFEIAFVFPSFGGSYKDRAASGQIVPPHRWTDNLTNRTAYVALRLEFDDCQNMELHIRCSSGHTRNVNIETLGRPLWRERKDTSRPFFHTPITFMMHATHEGEIHKIMEHGLQPGKGMTPQGTNACSHDVHRRCHPG